MLNFPTLSFNLLLLIRKYYNFEIVLYLYSDSVKKQPGSGSGLRFVAGSGSKFNQYRSETLPPIAFKRLAPILYWSHHRWVRYHLRPFPPIAAISSVWHTEHWKAFRLGKISPFDNENVSRKRRIAIFFSTGNTLISTTTEKYFLWYCFSVFSSTVFMLSN